MLSRGATRRTLTASANDSDATASSQSNVAPTGKTAPEAKIVADMHSFYVFVTFCLLMQPLTFVGMLSWPLAALWPSNVGVLAVHASLAYYGWSLILPFTFMLRRGQQLERSTIVYIFVCSAAVSLPFLWTHPAQQPPALLNGFLFLPWLLSWAPDVSVAAKYRVMKQLPIPHAVILLITFTFRRTASPAAADIIPLYYALRRLFPALSARRRWSAQLAAVHGSGGDFTMSSADAAGHALLSAVVYAVLCTEMYSRTHPREMHARFPRVATVLTTARRLISWIYLPTWGGTLIRVSQYAYGVYLTYSVAVAAYFGRVSIDVQTLYVHNAIIMAGIWVHLTRAKIFRSMVAALKQWRERVPVPVPVPSLADLHLLHELGTGATGTVYTALWKDMTVAAKLMPLRGNMSSEELAILHAEMQLSLHLRHPGIVTTYATFVSPAPGAGLSAADAAASSRALHRMARTAVLVSEVCPMGNLAKNIGLFHGPSGPRVVDILDTLLDMARAMAYLHAHHVVHGDLKPENVLLVERSSSARGFGAKLCDFGMSRILDEADSDLVTNHAVGTIAYTPPESLSSRVLSLAGDVWAFGIMMWQLFSAQKPYVNITLMQQLAMDLTRVSELLQPPAGMPAALVRLNHMCWHYDHKARITAQALLQHLEAFRASLESAR